MAYRQKSVTDISLILALQNCLLMNLFREKSLSGAYPVSNGCKEQFGWNQASSIFKNTGLVGFLISLEYMKIFVFVIFVDTLEVSAMEDS